MRFFTTLFLLICLICLLDAWGSRRRSRSRRSSIIRYKRPNMYTTLPRVIRRSYSSRRRTPTRRRFTRISTRRRFSRVSTRRRSPVSTRRRFRFSSTRRRTSTISTRRSFRFSSSRRRISTVSAKRRLRFIPSLKQPIPKLPTIKKGPFRSIREPDETGHRTGLGTIVRSFISSPRKTTKTFGAFKDNYDKMKKKNLIGGNLKAHNDGNYEATKIGGAKLAGAISALREQYKRFRIKKHPRDGSIHVGDTRTAQEIKATMDANKKGRDRALG